MNRQTDCLIYVQHLLGTGHLKRAALLARAMAAEGLSVTLASGGMPLRYLDIGDAAFVQLAPPIKSKDALFSALVDDKGNALDADMQAQRRAQLLALFDACRPRVVITEMFPLGRRQMRFEILPLLERAKAAAWQPKILSSVRDILNDTGKPEKRQWMLDTAAQYFDAILVHSDPNLVPLDASFSAAKDLRPKLRYTGFVVERLLEPLPPSARNREILVSAGGGAVAEPLLRAALEAIPLVAGRATYSWRLIAGDNLDGGTFDAIAAAAPSNAAVERSRRDFIDLLSRCALSVSQAGYNTAIEVLQLQTPAVFVPFAQGAETEQTLRAETLARRGRAAMVSEKSLDGARLADAILKQLSVPPPRDLSLALDGANTTAKIVKTLCHSQ